MRDDSCAFLGDSDMNNPFVTNGELVWRKFFSMFGVVICLSSFLLCGLISEEVRRGSFAIGGMFGFAFADILIYGFVCGFSLVPLIAICWFGTDPRLLQATITGIGCALIVIFGSDYEPPFRRVFWNWVRSREKSGQKRVV